MRGRGLISGGRWKSIWGGMGYLAPPGDADAMAARIVQLLEDGGSREEMSGRAAEDAKKSFDLRKQVDI